jgi:hypothetical protein
MPPFFTAILLANSRYRNAFSMLTLLILLLIPVTACVIALLPAAPSLLREIAPFVIMAVAFFGALGVLVSHRLVWESTLHEPYAHRTEDVKAAFRDGAFQVSSVNRRFLAVITVSVIALTVVAVLKKKT